MKHPAQPADPIVVYLAEFVALQDKLANRTPALLAAIEAALALVDEWNELPDSNLRGREAAEAMRATIAAALETAHA